MKRRPAGLLVSLTAAFALLVQAAGSPGQERKQDRPLRHDAAAIVKLVTVRVLGPEGRPVAGLRKEDFTLTEDGVPKTITEFEVHAITEAGMTIVPAAPASDRPADRAAEVMNRKLFFFLDQQDSDQAGKDKAKAAALHFLETQVRPGDEIAVLGWYSMSGFYIREYLTADLDRIRKAINGVIETRPSPGTPVGGGSSDGVDEGIPESQPARNLEALLAVRSAAFAVRMGDETVEFAPGTAALQRNDFVPRLAEIAEIFKTIPGHKSLILFTARSMGSEAERLGKLFGSAGTAVYAVNTQDWKMGPFFTKVKHIWTEHSLKNLSVASGGRYFADINDAAGIAKDVQDLTGNYYVLGYYIKDSWEGKYHAIRVEVARPEARVLVQDGFSDSKPFDRMTDFEKDIQLLDLLWSDQPSSVFTSLEIEPLIVNVKEKTEGCFLTRWDVGARTGPSPGPVEVIALLRGGAGETLASGKWGIDLKPYEGKTVWPYFTNPLPAGSCELRLVVRDARTGLAAVGRARFDVAVPPEEGIVLSTPLLFEEGKNPSFLRLPFGKSEKSKEKAAAAVSLMDLYHLIPKAGSPVIEEISPGTRRLLAVMPIKIAPLRPGDEPILSVEAKCVSLIDGSETELEVEMRDLMVSEGSPDILAVDLVLADLVPGRYELEISVEDMGTDRKASIRKPITVR
jgi:VWFA-related protein